jgi:hypothetical protein
LSVHDFIFICFRLVFVCCYLMSDSLNLLPLSKTIFLFLFINKYC